MCGKYCSYMRVVVLFEWLKSCWTCVSKYKVNRVWEADACYTRVKTIPPLFSPTWVLCWACRSSSAVYTSSPPTGGPPRLGPWWQTLRSLPARRWHHGTPLSGAAPEWSATAGSAWSPGSTLACRPTLGRQTLGWKREAFRWMIVTRKSLVFESCYWWSACD